MKVEKYISISGKITETKECEEIIVLVVVGAKGMVTGNHLSNYLMATGDRTHVESSSAWYRKNRKVFESKDYRL